MDAASFAGRIPPGTCSVSLFLVNDRIPSTDRDRDESFAFQPRSRYAAWPPSCLGPIPERSPARSGTSRSPTCTTPIPRVRGRPWGVRGLGSRGRGVPGAAHHLDARRRGREDGDLRGAGYGARHARARCPARRPALEAALSPLATAYRSWIDARKRDVGALGGERREAAEELLRLAGIAADRIERGIRTLAGDADALDAFRTANRAVADALSRRLAREGVRRPPRWRAFQLAFILLNLPGIADPASPEREFVDLLFFPTGGGKTEAYLGLAAFTMVLRRLRNPGDDHRAGAGVSVIMRYTLRLLTLDQLGRAAGLVCALERERRRDPGRLGGWPFEIGLWVGQGGHAQSPRGKGGRRSDSARSKVSQYKNNPRGKPSPIPLESCPWCGEDFTPESFTLLPDSDRRPISGSRARTGSASSPPTIRCPSSRSTSRSTGACPRSSSRRWTSSPRCRGWRVRRRVLGGADRHDHAGFYGAAEARAGNRLPRPLPPPIS